MRKRKIIFICILITGILVSINAESLVFAQQPEINIVIERIITTDFPNVDAYISIYDRNNLHVSGISAENINLFENDLVIDDFSIMQENNLDIPLSIALLIDTTGSMIEGNPSSLDNVIDAATNFINSLQPHDSVGIISFADEIKVDQPLTTEKSVLIDTLKNIQGVGNSPIYEAVYQGIDMVRNCGEKRIVVLITDGIESGESNYSLEDAISYAIEWQVPVYTVGFGPALVGPNDEISKGSKLDEISLETGAFAQYFQDSSNLQQAFSLINQFLRRVYLLNYTSKLPPTDSTQELTVEFSNVGFSYKDTRSFVPNPVKLNIISPQVGDILSIESIIRVEASSSSKIAQINFYANDKFVQTLSEPAMEESLYEATWDLLELSPGEYDIQIVAIDVIGNKSETNLPVVVREPIRIEFISPIDGEQLVTTPLINVQIDSVLDIALATLKLNNIELATFTDNLYTQEWPAHSIEKGIHRLIIDVIDVQGNNLSKEISVRIGTPPIGSELMDESFVISDESASILRLLMIIFIGGGMLITALLIAIPAMNKNRRPKQREHGLIREKSPAPNNEIANSRQIPNQPKQQHIDTPLILQEISGLAAGKEWPLENAEIRLGRKKDDNDIQLKGANASRRMAVIRKIGNTYLLHPLHPENPVIINDLQVTQQAVLNVGDIIKLGESIFSVITGTSDS